MLVPGQKRDFPDYRDPVQRGHRPETIRIDTKVILREPMGWCAVIEGFVHPLEDFLRGPLRKPTIEVQARAAFQSLFETYHPDVHAETIRSLEWDERLRLHHTMMCLQIANVVPEQERERHQEMWLIHVSKREEVAVCCTRTEWEHVLQSCEHAKECGWPTFMAQKAQDAHERRNFHIAEQITPDHFTMVLRNPEYWREISYQERNNNLLPSS